MWLGLTPDWCAIFGERDKSGVAEEKKMEIVDKCNSPYRNDRCDYFQRTFHPYFIELNGRNENKNDNRRKFIEYTIIIGRTSATIRVCVCVCVRWQAVS